MKTTLYILFSVFLVSACDNPARTRAPVTYVTSNNSSTTAGTASGAVGTTPGTINSGTTTAGGTTGSTTVSGFESCDLTQKYHTVDVGFFGLCQNTADKTIFKLSPGQTSSTSRVCLIPIFKDSNSKTMPIGDPQCTLTEAGKVVQGKLYKYSSYESYALSGVMVMKESLLTPYYNCMNAYAKWLPLSCPNGVYTNSYCSYYMPMCPNGGQSNQSCATAANTYMNSVCTSFKNTYSSSYTQIFF